MGTNPKVLLIEGADARRFALRNALMHAGYTVVEARTGSEAIDSAKNGPHAIVVNIQLPDSVGLTLCAKLKEIPATQHVPVLMIAPNFVAYEKKVRVLDGGVDAFLSEPFSHEELIAQVRVLVRLKEVQDQLRDREWQLRTTLDASQSIVFQWSIREDRVRRLQSAEIALPPTDGEQFEDVTRIVHPDDRDLFRANVRAALESTDGIYRSAFRIVRPTGEVRWLSETGRVEFDGARQPIRLLGLSQDITTTKLQDLALREKNERLRIALEASETGMWDWDVHTDQVTWSPQCYTIHGVKHGEFDGTAAGFDRLVHPEDKSRVWETVKAAVEQRTRYTSEFRIVRPNGEIRWVANSGRAFVNETTGAVHMLGTLTDITARKLSEKALREAFQQVENQNRVLESAVAERTARLRETVQQLETFSCTVVHDMRAPLRTIRGFAIALEETHTLDETGRNYVQRMLRSVNRMDSLITDVMSYSKIAMTETVLRTVNPEEVVRELLAAHPQFQGNTAIHIEGALMPILANSALVTQIFTILLGNALKFMPPGKQPDIRIRSENLGGTVKIIVEDNGIGIANEDIEKLFGLFQRLHSADKYPGSGVGLAIVKTAVNRMGGAVGVESTPNCGSKFWFILRSPEQHPPEVQNPRESANVDVAM